MNKLTKLPPAWHAEAAAALSQNVDAIHAAFMVATERAVSLGLFLNNVRQRGKEDHSIPHGEFGPWCTKHVLTVKYSQLHQYMALADGLIKFGKLQISDYRTFALGGKLPKEIELLIANKTQKQLLLEFKQADADGNPRGPGRLPGEGGKSAEPTGDIAEIAAFHRKYSIRHMGVIDNEYSKMGIRFLHCEDDHIAAFVSSAERAVKVGNYWLNTAPAKRDPKEAERIWNRH